MAREELKKNDGFMFEICYDKWWLRKDMENMGYIFEYCDKYIREIYGVEINKLKYLNAFMNSIFRKEMEGGHPKFLSQAARESVEDFIEYEYDNNPKEFIGNSDREFKYNQLYWVGWMYAYIHFREKLSSKEIIKIIPIEEMLDLYYLGHEMSKEVFYEKVKQRFN